MFKWAAYLRGAVWAGLATGCYTPERMVGTRVSEFVVRQLLADYLIYLVRHTSRIFDSKLTLFQVCLEVSASSKRAKPPSGDDKAKIRPSSATVFTMA